ncbi:MAG: hypothetical protein INR67_05340, partial [Jatrophihabitans endophyticus]
ENVTDAHGPTYPTHAAVDNGFAAAQKLGVQLVRSTTLGVSVGSPRSLEPTLGHFNAKAFTAIDYAVAEARKYGIHLMIPLTDEWHYYHGGKHTFTNWLGHKDIPGQNCVTSAKQRAREDYFYHGRRAIAAFHRYVAHLLNHVNPLTGLRLGSDPTIAIWETGNELWDAPPSWTQRTAAFIKTLAPRALVADGSAASGKDITQTGVHDRSVDVVDGHFYPTDSAKAVHDARYAAAQGKAYMVGEYPLTGTGVRSWLTTLSDHHAIAGGLAWSLFPDVDGVPEQHDDGYTFHVPGADPSEAREDADQRSYAHTVDIWDRDR